MKRLLIAGSLVANLALAAAVVMRPSLTPPSVAEFLTRHLHAGSDVGPDAPSARPSAPKPKPKLWSLLESDAPATVAARLRAAGFPPSLVRAVVTSLISARYDAQIRALNQPDPAKPYWKANVTFGFGDNKRYAELDRLYRERKKAIREAVGMDDDSDGIVSASQRRRYGNLTAPKIRSIVQIEDDYNEMTTAIRSGMNGIELPEDRDKFALLAQEKRADLLTVMTPDELADYEIRTSRLTDMLRSRLSGFDASETEFKAIYQAYQSLSQKFGEQALMNADQKVREQVAEDLQTQIKTTLGDARFNELSRAVDNEYQLVSRLAQQQGLPPDTADRTLAIRAATAQQSQQLAEDPALSFADKRNALKQLAESTKNQLTVLLGQNAADAYLRSANWLNLLNSGVGVSIPSTLPLMTINEGGGTSIIYGLRYRPIPPRPPRAPAQ